MRGLSLVEVLIATSVAAIVGVILVAIMVNNTGVFYTQTTKVSQGVASNDSLGKIRSYVREAQFIAANYPESGSPTYTSGSDTLILKVSSIDASGDILSTYDFVISYKNGDRLRLKVIADPSSQRPAVDQLLSNNVDSVLFQYFDSTGNSVTPAVATRVKVTLKIRQKAGSGYTTNLATTEARLRND